MTEVETRVEELLEYLRELDKEGDLNSREMFVSDSDYQQLLYKPQPFEFAKLEMWKPSKHSRGKRGKN